MWDSLWLEASLATMADGTGFGKVDRGALAIDAGTIAWVGEESALPGPPDRLAREVHRVPGTWITPGLIDCHTHLVFAGTRAQDFAMRLAGADRSQILQAGGGVTKTIHLTREATQAQLVSSGLRRAATLAAEGVTTLEIKSGYGLDLENEIKILTAARAIGASLPVDVITTFGLYAIPDDELGDRGGYIRRVCEYVLPKVVRAGLVTAIDVQLDELGFTKDEAARLFRTARDLGLEIRVHTDELSDFGGTEFAARFGARTADHLEYLSENGVVAMARTGMTAVLLPGNTHILKRSRIPPVELLRRYGIPMAVATNCNPGPSPTTSILLMMNMACVLYGLTPAEALASTTKHAASALALERTHGTLEIGKVADFVVWEIEDPVELSYYLGFNPAQQVIKGGRIVLTRSPA